MAPTDPDTQPRAEDEAPSNAPRRRRWPYRLTVIVLCIGSAVMLYLDWQLLREIDRASTSNRLAEPTPSTAPATPRRRAEPLDLLDLLEDAAPQDGESATSRILHRVTGAEPLDHEPAHLPAPPDGKRLWRFARRQGDHRAQVAAWRIAPAESDDMDESVRRLATFYRDAAEQRGYHFLPHAGPSADTSPHTRRLLFEAPPRADRAAASPPPMLTIHLSPRDGSVHVLIVLRYAMAVSR